MGLFGKLFKGAGKLLGGVARAGLSVATHGASDKVLGLLKGLGRSKASGSPKREQLTMQQQALLNKVAEPLAPRVKITQLQESAQAGNEQYGSYGPTRRRTYGKRKPAYGTDSYWAQRTGTDGSPRPAAPKAAKAAGAKRTLSPAMMVRANKMRALAATWRGLGGREGTGMTFFEWKRGK